MNILVSRICTLILLQLIVGLPMALAQVCINKYSSVKFTGSTYDTILSSATTPAGEIIIAGRLFDFSGAAHIAKFSAKGTPIWSYQYALDYFSFYPPMFFKTVSFSEIISCADGGYVVAGNLDQELSPFGSPPPVKKYALVIKL